MLFALFFRPVGFDYRSKVPDPRWRSAWDWGLFIGGFVPALVFGVAFGNLLQGVPFHFDADHARLLHGIVLRRCSIRSRCWPAWSASRCSPCTAAIYLQLRTDGRRAGARRRAARIAGVVFIVAFAAAGVWVATGIEGYRIVAMPIADTAFLPLAKTVERVRRRLARQLRAQPLDAARAGRRLRRRGRSRSSPRAPRRTGLAFVLSSARAWPA